MKVLTLKEPWAALIGAGIKRIETRSWKTNYRGELFIHTGLKSDEVPKELMELFKTAKSMPGHITIKCNIVDCILIDEKYAQETKNEDELNYICGDYSVGRYAWILEDVEYIEPIKISGKLGLWCYEAEG